MLNEVKSRLCGRRPVRRRRMDDGRWKLGGGQLQCYQLSVQLFLAKDDLTDYLKKFIKSYLSVEFLINHFPFSNKCFSFK
jgi:hypothetical protein